jgi:type II secretory pathway pseudopilin PulG
MNRQRQSGFADRTDPQLTGEQGFMLLGLIVAIAIILLVLSIAAPKVARDLRRERDLETVHRGNDYVHAIRRYYIQFKHYPGSMEQLEKTNNIRFLRQRYKDPITGKDDWRTIPVGQNKTTVKGFFGEPLAGLPTTGLGAVAGMASPGIGQTPASGPGGGATSGIGGASPGFGSNTGIGGSSPTSGAAGSTNTAGTAGATGTTGATGTGAAGDTSTGTSSVGSQPATGFSGTTMPFMGVGLNAPGDSIVELNEQTTYATWEFLYDPRIELLKAKGGLNSAGSIGAGALGQPPVNGVGPTGKTPTLGTGSPSDATPPAAPVVGAPVQP